MAENVFSAELRNIKQVYSVLKGIVFRENANFRVSSDAIKITIDEMRCVQTSAYIPAEMFVSYNLNSENDVCFKINLKMFVECLNIFGDDANSGLKLVYERCGGSLLLILHHDEVNVTVDCKLNTMEAEDVLDYNLADECRTNKVVLRAKTFSKIIRDLDVTSSEVTLILSPDEPFFRLSTNGVTGTTETDISPKSEMIELFKCTKLTKQRFTLGFIKQLEKIISLSSRVSLSTSDTVELLAVQLIIDSVDTTTFNSLSMTVCKMFVEYFCMALLDDE